MEQQSLYYYLICLERIPKSLSQDIIITLYKNEDRSYTKITLLIHCVKIYEKIMEKRKLKATEGGTIQFRDDRLTT